MGSLRVTLCTGVLAAVVLTPTAHAADGGGVSVTPAVPAPGSDVTLRVTGCPERTAVAASAAFVADTTLTGADATLTGADATLSGVEGALTGDTRVRTTITPGTYAVKVSCGSADRTGTITVGPVGSAAPRLHGPAAPSGHASPVAPVDAGGGGAAHLVAVDDREAGPGTAHTVTGLLLAGAAAVAVALRGARRSRGTG